MITFSDDRVKSLLSLPGNNKCLECESTSVEWVSFPTTIFLCSSCGRKHKGFSNNEILKSLSISEFTQKEEEKLKIGGNERYLSFLKEYNISVTEPNIESKYLTFATAYYNALIEAEINKNNNVSGSEQTLNKLISQKPSNELGPQIMEDTPNIYMELINSIPSNKDMGFGGFFGFIGNQIYNAAEQLGINKAYDNAKNAVDSTMNEYGIKEAIGKGVNYAKSAGQYVVDKGMEIASTPMVQGAVSKVKEGVNYVNESASSMLSNITGKTEDNANSENNVQQENNLDFLNDNNSQSVYQQLNHDQM
jgi:ribosomal protein L37AE/L43A